MADKCNETKGKGNLVEGNVEVGEATIRVNVSVKAFQQLSSSTDAARKAREEARMARLRREALEKLEGSQSGGHSGSEAQK
ncbi:hypothetical protein McaMca56_005928 [Microsporum canis]